MGARPPNSSAPCICANTQNCLPEGRVATPRRAIATCDPAPIHLGAGLGFNWTKIIIKKFRIGEKKSGAGRLCMKAPAEAPRRSRDGWKMSSPECRNGRPPFEEKRDRTGSFLPGAMATDALTFTTWHAASPTHIASVRTNRSNGRRQSRPPGPTSCGARLSARHILRQSHPPPRAAGRPCVMHITPT